MNKKGFKTVTVELIYQVIENVTFEVPFTMTDDEILKSKEYQEAFDNEMFEEVDRTLEAEAIV